MMVGSDSGLFKVRKPQVNDRVSRRTVHTLAERLFRKNLAAQYVAQDHFFLETEDRLIQDSVSQLRKQLEGVMMVHLTIAGIHLMVMDAAKEEAEATENHLGDVEEHVLENALVGVEEDSLKVLSALCLPQ